MRFLKTVAVAAIPLFIAAGCETTSQDDKMMIEKANASADAAKKEAMEATSSASRAAAAADRAAKAAQDAADAAARAAAEAKAAGDKADRVFKRQLRK